MELLSVLRLLVRRRLLVALGLLAAVLVALVGSGVLGIGPAAAPERTSAVALARIQIDTARPLAADLGASDATIDAQTVMLGESLADAGQQAALARAAEIPSADLTVRSTGIEQGLDSRLRAAARDAARTSREPYVVTVASTPDVPILTVVAAGPDRRTSERLASAAAPVLDALAVQRAPADWRRLSAEQLGPVRVAQARSGAVSPLLGVAGGLVLFAAWCGAIVVGGGLARVARSGSRMPRGGHTLPRT